MCIRDRSKPTRLPLYCIHQDKAYIKGVAQIEWIRVYLLLSENDMEEKLELKVLETVLKLTYIRNTSVLFISKM